MCLNVCTYCIAVEHGTSNLFAGTFRIHSSADCRWRRSTNRTGARVWLYNNKRRRRTTHSHNCLSNVGRALSTKCCSTSRPATHAVLYTTQTPQLADRSDSDSSVTGAAPRTAHCGTRCGAGRAQTAARGRGLTVARGAQHRKAWHDVTEVARASRACARLTVRAGGNAAGWLWGPAPA